MLLGIEDSRVPQGARGSNRKSSTPLTGQFALALQDAEELEVESLPKDIDGHIRSYLRKHRLTDDSFSLHARRKPDHQELTILPLLLQNSPSLGPPSNGKPKSEKRKAEKIYRVFKQWQAVMQRVRASLASSKAFGALRQSLAQAIEAATGFEWVFLDQFNTDGPATPSRRNSSPIVWEDEPTALSATTVPDDIVALEDTDELTIAAGHASSLEGAARDSHKLERILQAVVRCEWLVSGDSLHPEIRTSLGELFEVRASVLIRPPLIVLRRLHVCLQMSSEHINLLHHQVGILPNRARRETLL